MKIILLIIIGGGITEIFAKNNSNEECQIVLVLIVCSTNVKGQNDDFQLKLPEMQGENVRETKLENKEYLWRILLPDSDRMELISWDSSNAILQVHGSITVYYSKSQANLWLNYVADKNGFRANFKFGSGLVLAQIPASFDTRISGSSLKTLTVLDCLVGDWGQWSECNTACGSGTMTRSRKILQPAQNGGKHCPTLMQKRGCQGFRCHGHHDKKILHETALLLPASLTHNHHSNDSDIRRNLRAHYRETYKHNREQEYCVEFEVLKTSKACHKLPPYNLLIEGDRIIVRCDVEAYVEDFLGINDNNLTTSTLKTNHRNDATYQRYDTPNTSAEEDGQESDENMIDSSSSGSDEHDDYDTASLTVKTSTTTTTTTSTTTAYPPAQAIQYHCRGEGLPGRTTRWSALAAPSCRGKWLRLTLDAPKKCTHPQFMFV